MSNARNLADLLAPGENTLQTVAIETDRIILNGTDGSASNAGDDLLLDASAASTNVGERFTYEDGTDDGSAVLSSTTLPASDSNLENFKLSETDKNSTIKSEGGAVTTNIAQGLAKMWLSFNGTGTIAVDDSLNIASLTDAGTGNYTNTFTNGMSAATFAAFAGGDVNNSNNDIRRNNRLYNTTTALVKVSCGNNGGSDSKEDWTEVFTAAFGDLA